MQIVSKILIIFCHPPDSLEITTTNKCPFCDIEKEFLSHRFYACVEAASFWDNVSSWIESKLKCRLELQTFNMLFGIGCNQNFYSIINYIIHFYTLGF